MLSRPTRRYSGRPRRGRRARSRRIGRRRPDAPDVLPLMDVLEHRRRRQVLAVRRLARRGVERARDRRWRRPMCVSSFCRRPDHVACHEPSQMPRPTPPAGDIVNWPSVDVVVREPRQQRDGNAASDAPPTAARRPPARRAASGKHDEADGREREREQHEDRPAQRRQRRAARRARRTTRRSVDSSARSANQHRQREQERRPDLGHHERAEVRKRREERRRRAAATSRDALAGDAPRDGEHEQADRREQRASARARPAAGCVPATPIDRGDEQRIHRRADDFGHELRRVGEPRELAGRRQRLAELAVPDLVGPLRGPVGPLIPDEEQAVQRRRRAR